MFSLMASNGRGDVLVSWYNNTLSNIINIDVINRFLAVCGF